MLQMLSDYAAKTNEPNGFVDAINIIFTTQHTLLANQGPVAVAAAMLASDLLSLPIEHMFTKLGSLSLQTLSKHCLPEIDHARLVLPKQIDDLSTEGQTCVLLAIANAILITPVMAGTYTNIYNPATMLITTQLLNPTDKQTAITALTKRHDLTSATGLAACIDVIMDYMLCYNEPLATVFADRVVLLFSNVLKDIDNTTRNESFNELRLLPDQDGIVTGCLFLVQTYYDFVLDKIEMWDSNRRPV